MADNNSGGPAKGKAHGGDQSAMPGQAQGGLPFGLANSLSTGAPGTAGTPASAPDPTVTSAVPGTVFGSPNDTKTGAPGGSGATAGVATGAAYTIDTGLGNRPFTDAAGGSVDSESQGNKYGAGNGFPGDYQPKSTGAGQGQTLIGGRRVRQE